MSSQDATLPEARKGRAGGGAVIRIAPADRRMVSETEGSDPLVMNSILAGALYQILNGGQRFRLSEAVSIPVFVSSLLQVPLVYQMTRVPVGVLTASAPSLTEKHIAGAGCEGIPIVVQGLEGTEEFAAVILRNERLGMDLGKVEQEVLVAGRALIEKAPEIGAVVLECTDLPPYAYQLQAALGRPVFDLTTLATMMHDVVSRQVYLGTV